MAAHALSDKQRLNHLAQACYIRFDTYEYKSGARHEETWTCTITVYDSYRSIVPRGAYEGSGQRKQDAREAAAELIVDLFHRAGVNVDRPRQLCRLEIQA